MEGVGSAFAVLRWGPFVRGRAALSVLAVIAVVLSVGSAGGTSASRASLGNTRVGASFDQGGPDYLDVSGPFRTNGGTISALTAYVHGESRALSFRAVVYTDVGGRPARLIGTTNVVKIAADAASAWVRLALRKAIRLVRGGYWLGFWYGPGTGSGGGGFAYSSVPGREWYARATYTSSGAPPARFPLGAGSGSSSSYSIYATLAASKPHAAATPKHARKPVAPQQGQAGQRPGNSGSAGGQAGSATHGSYAFYEDSREGFPKIAAYRPGCSTSAAQAARFDWFITDGSCDSVLDSAHALNHQLLGMIQPTNPANGDLFAATYGAYDLMTSPVSDPALGTIRAFRSSDLLHDTNGGVHAFGSVDVLNWLSSDTALWSADVVAYWARRDGALSSAHPGIMGVWGDNDFWSDQGYAFTGTPLDAAAAGSATAAANRAVWDTNAVAHHDRLAHDLPGMVIGGNDISSYAASPGSYRGGQVNGWLLPGVSAAGMRECADRYFGLYTASGMDSIITSAQAFLAGKALDGKQRYVMLNDCNATSDRINEYALAVATIGGLYYWPYAQSGFWASTLTIAPSIPDVTRNGVRNWLGFPIAAPQKLASGLWKRTFQHGVVYANMTGSTQTVDGHTLADESGLFVSS